VGIHGINGEGERVGTGGHGEGKKVKKVGKSSTGLGQPWVGLSQRVNQQLMNFIPMPALDLRSWVVTCEPQFHTKLGLFVDRAITAALEPYKNLNARIDDIETKAVGKCPQVGDGDKGKSHKKKKHKKRKQEKAELREALKQSRTLVTPPPVIEASSPDLLSVIVATDSTTEVCGVTQP
ncbi:hypothetical protein HAX54_024962, partial [Datura stramonium]|nr:hypothetical protein [Datura stramonium]